MPFAIQHDRAAHRFETEVDGVECELDYTLTDAVMTITHTGVPARTRARDGQEGRAGVLVCRRVDRTAPGISRSVRVKLPL